MPLEVLAHPIDFPIIAFADKHRFRHSAFVLCIRIAEARTNFEYENRLVFDAISNVELRPDMRSWAYRLYERSSRVLNSFPLDIVKGHTFPSV